MRSLGAPHLFRASDNDTRSEQNSLIDRLSKCIDIVVQPWWWRSDVRLGHRLRGLSLFRHRKDAPHRSPYLLHLRHDAVLEAEWRTGVPAYERWTHASRVRRHDRAPERKIIVQ
jgi:hypothetical protein